MNTIRFTSREAFVAALEARRPFWRDYDKQQAREHKAKEQAYLTEARAKFREAVKWDYPTLKQNLSWNGTLRLLEDKQPDCPVLMESKIDRVLAALKFTQGKAFTVDTTGAWSEAHTLLTWDPDAQTKAC